MRLTREERWGAWRQGMLELLEPVVYAVVVVTVLSAFFMRIEMVSGDSMKPTLHEGDRLLVQQNFYRPQVGDVVICNQPNFSGKPFVKRIIALGGQTVDIDFLTGIVTVDGEVLVEPYLYDLIRNTPAQDQRMEFPLTVPKGQLFVMGDNRNYSTDSRSILIGTVDERYVVGRVWMRLYPLDQMGRIE